MDDQKIRQKTFELMAEFEQHLKDAAEQGLDDRQIIFESFVFLRLAALELAVSEISELFSDNLTKDDIRDRIVVLRYLNKVDI